MGVWKKALVYLGLIEEDDLEEEIATYQEAPQAESPVGRGGREVEHRVLGVEFDIVEGTVSEGPGGGPPGDHDQGHGWLHVLVFAFQGSIVSTDVAGSAPMLQDSFR